MRTHSSWKTRQICQRVADQLKVNFFISQLVVGVCKIFYRVFLVLTGRHSSLKLYNLRAFLWTRKTVFTPQSIKLFRSWSLPDIFCCNDFSNMLFSKRFTWAGIPNPFTCPQRSTDDRSRGYARGRIGYSTLRWNHRGGQSAENAVWPR